MTPTTCNRRAARLCLPQQPEEAAPLLHVAWIEHPRPDWIVHSAGLFLTRIDCRPSEELR
jgi:hypothetical protein